MGEVVLVENIDVLGVVSSGFIVWLTGLASGVTLRYFRNIITSGSNV